MHQRYLEDLVGVAHGGDFVVGVGSSQFAQVANWSSADLTVHVHFLHLVLWAHEHLKRAGEKQTGNELSFQTVWAARRFWTSPEIELTSALLSTDKSSAFKEQHC